MLSWNSLQNHFMFKVSYTWSEIFNFRLISIWQARCSCNRWCSFFNLVINWNWICFNAIQKSDWKCTRILIEIILILLELFSLKLWKANNSWNITTGQKMIYWKNWISIFYLALIACIEISYAMAKTVLFWIVNTWTKVGKTFL